MTDDTSLLRKLSPEERETMACLLRKAGIATTDAIDDSLLLRKVVEEIDIAVQAEEVKALCKMHTGLALARLSELAQTAADPGLRRQAAAVLAEVSERLRETGQDVSRWSTEEPGDKPN